MKRIILPIAILTAAVGVGVILVMNPTQIDEAAVEVIPVSVRVMEVKSEPARLTVTSQGKVQAAMQVNLSASVAGMVTWVSPSLEAGGFVDANHLLVRLEPSDYETAVARSQSGLLQAEAEANHAQAELERMRNLAEQRLASQSQLQDAQRSDAIAQARLTEARANLQQAQMDLARTEIRAPFRAVIQSKAVELGQYVNRAQDVAVLFGADIVEVRVPLAIRQLGFLDIPLGQRGELPDDVAPAVMLTGMYGGIEHKWTGKLVRVEAAIDPNSNAVQSIIRVEQPADNDVLSSGWNSTIPLPIGLYVEAEITGRELDDVISLPRSVIRNNNQVLVVDAENKMYFRDVEIFRLEAQRVLISGGLYPGEFICISPIQAVYDGMSVSPVRDVI
ncbi:MAG: efflux RND transporter periplasmic adaptor subunit [Pseudohongiellaceae bacterium]